LLFLPLIITILLNGCKKYHLISETKSQTSLLGWAAKYSSYSLLTSEEKNAIISTNPQHKDRRTSQKGTGCSQ
jgi:hypothetical protein